MQPNEKAQAEAKILAPKEIRIIIPQCCRENWPTCTHVPRRQRKVRGNIGL